MGVQTNIVTDRSFFQLGLSANSDAANYTALPTNLAEPTSGDDVVVIDGSRNLLALQAVITDADNETALTKVVGFRKYMASATSTLWIPCLLVEFTWTAGVAATQLGTNHFLADTVTISSGDTDAKVISPADSTNPAIAVVDMLGCEKVGVYTKVGTGAGVNVFWATL